MSIIRKNVLVAAPNQRAESAVKKTTTAAAAKQSKVVRANRGKRRVKTH